MAIVQLGLGHYTIHNIHISQLQAFSRLWNPPGPIKAHTAVAMQHMPCGCYAAYALWAIGSDYQIWENITHVALQEILLARIRGI